MRPWSDFCPKYIRLKLSYRLPINSNRREVVICLPYHRPIFSATPAKRLPTTFSGWSLAVWQTNGKDWVSLQTMSATPLAEVEVQVAVHWRALACRRRDWGVWVPGCLKTLESCKEGLKNIKFMIAYQLPLNPTNMMKLAPLWMAKTTHNIM